MGKWGCRWWMLILALGVFWGLPSWADEGRPVGTLVRIEGRVDITPPGGRAEPARRGQPLRVGDILRTKSRSRAEVRFIDGSRMRMAETSRVEIDRYMVDDGRTDGLLHLFRGKIQTIVQKSKGFFNRSKPNRFEVHTKNAVCGVRGTNYFSSYVNGASDFIFKEGHGYGYNKNLPGQVAEVFAGQALQVRGKDGAPRLRPASRAEIEAHGSDTEAGDGEESDGEGDDASPDDPTGDGDGGSTAPGDAEAGSGEGDGEDSYADGAVPGAEVFDDIFAADGTYTDEAMEALNEIFGPASMMTDPVVPWEEEQINSGMTTSITLTGTLAQGLGFSLSGTWDTDQWAPPMSYIDLLKGDIDASHQFFVTPGGFWYDGAVAGGILGLWAGTDGGAGLLLGDFTGTYSLDGTWETGASALNSIEMTSSAAAAATADPIPDPEPILYQYCDDVGRDFPSGAGTITVLNPHSQIIGGWVGLPDQDWGVFRAEINGTFTDGVTDAWHLALNGLSQSSGYPNIQWMEIEGAQWSNAEIHGTATGAWVDLENATTGLLGGAVAGVFDPADPKNIWDMVIGGTWLGTERFLDMMASSRNAELDAMGIPRFEVGSTTLSGTDGNLNVQINDMTFFASASGQKPEIWASGNVAGSYASDPAVGAEVLLDGVGFSNVSFSVERWDGTGGKWGAEIVGAGQVSGHSVTVVGGAAGTIGSGIAPAGQIGPTGTFSGTAAGVAGDGAAAVVE